MPERALGAHILFAVFDVLREFFRMTVVVAKQRCRHTEQRHLAAHADGLAEHKFEFVAARVFLFRHLENDGDLFQLPGQ